MSPFADLRKNVVLREARIFNDRELQPGKCAQVLTKLLYLLSQGESLSSEEATEVFFSVTKLFQSPDPHLRRLIYLMLKELQVDSDSSLIVVSCLSKDMVSKSDLFRANSIRVLSAIMDTAMVQQMERFLKQAIVDKSPFIMASALCASQHLFLSSPEVVKRWLNEIQEALNNKSKMVQYHALALLYRIRQHDKLALSKVVTGLARHSPSIQSSPMAQLLHIRIITSLLLSSPPQANSANTVIHAELLKYLADCLHAKHYVVMYEAARSLVRLDHLLTAQQLVPAISVIQEMLTSVIPAHRFAAVKTLSEVVVKYPQLVSPCLVDLEHCINDSNRSIATLAITTLLKTGVESNVDRLMKSISGFMADISDEFKIVLVDAIRSLCLKFPHKFPSLLNFLASSLREEGGYRYKKAIVDAMLAVIADVKEAQELGLECFCEFIEDCVDGDALVAMADGTARPLREVRAGDAVLAYRDGGLAPSPVTRAVNKGAQQCVELLLNDGRTLVCTPDHRVLTADRRWVAAAELQVGVDAVSVGVEPPCVSVSEAMNSDWSLDLSVPFNAPLVLNTHTARAETLAFARLLGHYLTGSAITSDGQLQPAVRVEHRLDLAEVAADIALLCAAPLEQQRDAAPFHVTLPAVLTDAFRAVGVEPGSRAGELRPVPAFLLQADCPVPVLREFLAGLFGGGGATVLLGAAQSSSQRPDCCCTKQAAAVDAQLFQLLTRCGVDVSDAALSGPALDLCALTESGAAKRAALEATGEKVRDSVDERRHGLEADYSCQLALHLGSASVESFAAGVGVRYCCHKTQRLTAGASFLRQQSVLTRQRNAVARRAQLLHTQAKVAGRGLSVAAAISQAKAWLAEQEQLLPLVRSWNAARADALVARIGLSGPGLFTLANQLELQDTPQLCFGSCQGGQDDVVKRQLELGAATEHKVAVPGDSAASATAASGVSCDVRKDESVLPVSSLLLVGRRDVGLREVFDISVPSGTSFVAGGVVVHNCEFPELSCRILHVLGERGPSTSNPAKYIRFVFNRVILETASVRCAAVSSLAKFGVNVPQLTENVVVLLNRCLTDNDDEVRDRAVFYVNLLTKETQLARQLVNSKQQTPLFQMQQSLLAFLQRPGAAAAAPFSLHKDLVDVGEDPESAEERAAAASAAPSAATAQSAASAATPAGSAAAASAESINPHLELLRSIPELAALGAIFKSCAPVSLTEAESEYVVVCIKHILPQHVVFQFNVTNQMENQQLEQVTVEMDCESGEWEEELSIPEPQLQYGLGGVCFSVFKRPPDAFVSGSISCVLHFKVKEVDDGELVDADGEGVSDEYQLEEIEVSESDFMRAGANTGLLEFKRQWEELGEQQEIVKKYSLGLDNLQSAVSAVLDLLGMQACEGSGQVAEGARSHAVNLTGQWFGGVPVLARAGFMLDARHGVTLKIAVRSRDQRVNQMLTNAIR